MTVAELIEKLKEMPQDIPVLSDLGDIRRVWLMKWQPRDDDVSVGVEACPSDAEQVVIDGRLLAD